MAGCFGNNFFDRDAERRLMNYLDGECEWDNWVEDVLGNKISEQFYNDNEAWVDEYDGQCNKWLSKLYKNKTAEQAAAIIERAFAIYIKKAG